ncbi:hypothetical protein K1T71_010174 [Dendrolimus kikuchii]|uniref:Uncharacterized protein n=1 Tax=Dendrolimus kikuchii TaxID=765133 RepID=A0ACC1CR55_9NEOP|nr:hypothetical protein K1T71_010174 [Dendrolimus kikuchii]
MTRYDEYLTAMKRVHRRYSSKSAVPAEMLPPRDRHRNRDSQQQTMMEGIKGNWNTVQEAGRIGTIASMVPDEIIYRHYDHSLRSYEAALMFIDVSVRPAVIAAIRSTWWPGLRRFMVTPVLRAVDNDEPMDFLTEVRRVVVVFLNIITATVSTKETIETVNIAYQRVSSVTSASGGLVNKVSMFDKDMMFLVVFGLRGLKHEDEARKALLCAYKLKEKLNDENIITVSIGITSGTTYCGVVGHILRREYTVIGPAVNKAARLMMAYPNKVTCDKETCLRSKIDQDYFRLMETKLLKGIAKPGPIYEFNINRWPERLGTWRHPIIGRNDELQRYKIILQNAIHRKQERFTRFKYHKFGIAFIGPKMIGKTRLVEECLNITPNCIRVEKITLDESDKVSYELFRMILVKTLNGGNTSMKRTNLENRIRYCIDTSTLTPLEIYALNTIFDIRFPLPENYQYTGDFLNEVNVKNVLQNVIKSNFIEMWVIAVDAMQHADDESWRLLILLMESKSLFVIMTLINEESLSPVAKECFRNEMIVKIKLSGIDGLYHAALACQLLDVQAIPADFATHKWLAVIESASGGSPGWIQNFVISLVQRGALSVVTVTRSEALAAGAIIPLPTLLQRSDYDVNICPNDDTSERKHSYQSIYSVVSTSMMSRQDSSITMADTEKVQMAVLADSFNFDNVKVDMTMDAIILKIYDALTPFEKMLLKCSSVLGEVFSRRMLLHLLQSDSPRRVAEANCRDLPMYAFCGYMKFRHSLFRTTTYELLTESQKLEMHARALLYLERYTRRCSSCGAGCFAKLLGLRIDDGLRKESEAMKLTRQQICALGAETRVVADSKPSSSFTNEHRPTQFNTINLQADLSNYDVWENDGTLFSRILESRSRQPSQQYGKSKRVRSFSSLETNECDCLSILLFVYTQIIDHCRGAGEEEKLFEAYMEYADLSILNINLPQAIRLLYEVENLVTNKPCTNDKKHKNWMHQYHLARISSLRGVCMLDSGDMNEARKQLLHAMKLYYDPFPTTKYGVRFRSFQASLQQIMSVYIAPNCYVARDTDVIGYFYEDIAKTLNRLCRLFTECKEDNNAALAAKWALNYALRTNSNFRILCFSYGNMIATYRQRQKFNLCLKLEKAATELCHRKRGQLDVTEIQAVSYLYTSIFLCYAEIGKKIESLEFGLSVMHMMTNLIDLHTRQMLVLWMLKLLLTDLKIHEMVSTMREFFYMTNQYDLSSETWYYFCATVILLDTGYCVESYNACERFYIKKGDAILRSRTPEAAGNFFVSMWLITIRIGAWEKSILWEEKIKEFTFKFDKNEFNTMIPIRITEGLLISLVHEMNNRNVKKIIAIEKAIKTMIQKMKTTCAQAPFFNLLLAYNNYIKGKKETAFSYLSKARDLAKHYSNGIIRIWVEHTRNHWQKTLNPKYEYYWIEHVEPDNLLDFRDFDTEKVIIIPYTLPLPQELDM